VVLHPEVEQKQQEANWTISSGPFNSMNMADSRGRVKEKRPTDKDIADYMENLEPAQIIISCRTINFNLVIIMIFFVSSKSHFGSF